MREFLERFKRAWVVFVRMAVGKPLTILDFQNVLSMYPEKPLAKVVHTTRKFTAVQFIVKIPRPKNTKTQKGVAW